MTQLLRYRYGQISYSMWQDRVQQSQLSLTQSSRKRQTFGILGNTILRDAFAGAKYGAAINGCTGRFVLGDGMDIHTLANIFEYKFILNNQPVGLFNYLFASVYNQVKNPHGDNHWFANAVLFSANLTSFAMGFVSFAAQFCCCMLGMAAGVVVGVFDGLVLLTYLHCIWLCKILEQPVESWASATNITDAEACEREDVKAAIIAAMRTTDQVLDLSNRVHLTSLPLDVDIDGSINIRGCRGLKNFLENLDGIDRIKLYRITKFDQSMIEWSQEQDITEAQQLIRRRAEKAIFIAHCLGSTLDLSDGYADLDSLPLNHLDTITRINLRGCRGLKNFLENVRMYYFYAPGFKARYCFSSPNFYSMTNFDERIGQWSNAQNITAEQRAVRARAEQAIFVAHCLGGKLDLSNGYADLDSLPPLHFDTITHINLRGCSGLVSFFAKLNLDAYADWYRVTEFDPMWQKRYLPVLEKWSDRGHTALLTSENQNVCEYIKKISFIAYALGLSKIDTCLASVLQNIPENLHQQVSNGIAGVWQIRC